MTRKREIYTFEEDGRFYITDQYDTTRVIFNSAEERQKWIDGYFKDIGEAIVIEHKPDVMANLQRPIG